MAWTQTDLDAIEDAIKSGTKRVKYADKEVEYRDLDEMMRVREAIRRELGVTKRTQRFYPNFSKGLDEC